MNLSRRSFLKFTLVGSAFVAAPITFSKIGSLPVIVGDGIHDDTAGLQAAVNGEPFACLSGCVSVSRNIIDLTDGTYRITDTITIGKSITSLVGGTLKADFPIGSKNPLILVGNGVENTRMQNMTIINMAPNNAHAAIRVN